MAVVEGIDALERAHGRLFVVVGVFDGLHLGHEYLLRELRRVAAEHDARPAVITFDHHPDEILKGSAPPLLCDPEERLERLAAAGVAVTVVQTFDRALRETSYEAFVRRIAGRVELAGFLMTPESAFGFERRGTPETVADLGRSLGYDSRCRWRCRRRDAMRHSCERREDRSAIARRSSTTRTSASSPW
jgi:riboflavin kinase/FMN adenylyltransferase